MKNFKSLAMSVIGSICLHTAMAATVVEVAVTPEAKQTRQDIWPTITQVLMTAPRGDVVTVFDSTSGLRVATIKVTDEMDASPNPNARTTWLMKQQGGEVAKAKKFLADQATASGSGDFVRWIRSLEVRKAEFPGVQRFSGVFFGSPLVTAPEAYSMKNRYPSDAFLFMPDVSLFSTLGKEKALSNVDIHVVHSPGLAEFSERNRDYHQTRIKRFYGLFISTMGGSLASFGGTADHLKNISKTAYPKVSYGAAEKNDGKPIIYEVQSPQLERQDTGRQKSLWEGTIDKNPTAPTRQSAPFDIGITWNRNVDLDIYVMPPGDKELSFQKTTSEKYNGRFLKDIVSLPGTNGFETVVYDSDVPFRELRVYINHYAGASNEPIDGELRIRIEGATYAKKFRFPPGQGTRGQGSRDSSPAWMKIEIAKVVGLPS
jgi:hypothetical protein